MDFSRVEDCRQVADGSREFLTILTSSINAGTAPGAEMLCSSRLTTLDKVDGGIRPLAVEEVMYRLAMKTILDKALAHKSPLLLSQLGVKSKGSVEPIARGVERALVGTLDQDYTHLVSLDASNAFNAISRSIIADMIRKHIPSLYKCAKWAYQTPADLVVGEWILESRQGVRQGDPVGPLYSHFACDRFWKRSRPTSAPAAKWSLIWTTYSFGRPTIKPSAKRRPSSRIGPTRSD